MDLSDQIKIELPYLRRYARALTGSQAKGDDFSIEALQLIMQDRSELGAGVSVKIGLFTCFHKIWAQKAISTDAADTPLEAQAQKHLGVLSHDTREALLLSTLEGFSADEIAHIIGSPAEAVPDLIARAQADMADAAKGRVLIIEDEPLIAMDLQSIVTDIGHTVTGLARTHTEAVEMGQEDRPDLILSDIQLADNSSGIEAVQELLLSLGDVPVVFVTAFPERLLTGNRPEPAFLISKPYREDQIESTVSQALFFSTTETLHQQAGT